MGIYSKKVKGDFLTYDKVLCGLKVIKNGIIALSEGAGAHRRYWLGVENATVIYGKLGRVKVRQSKSEITDYGFQILVDGYDKAIFRFDADGATHYNDVDEALPLLKREITTPHFHKFNESGKEIAYKTEELHLHGFEIQNDIHLGFSYFCDEAHVIDSKGDPVKIINQQELFPEQLEYDVHRGVKFP